MKNPFPACLACLVIAFGPAPAAAQTQGQAPPPRPTPTRPPPMPTQQPLPVPVDPATAAAASALERLLEKKESKWKCAKLTGSRGASAGRHMRGPFGTYYRLDCRRKDFFAHGVLFYGDSEQDAAGRLEWALEDPTLFQGKPLPLAELGEHAYQQQLPARAIVAFRKDRVYAQLTVVGISPAGTLPQSQWAKASAEALKIARRFAGHIAGQKVME